MATTRLIPLHVGKGSSIAAALGRSKDYVENPDKTDGGEWISSYQCDHVNADAEFLFSKRQYALITGRDQGERDVIAYHLRQAFKPGEVDPATANAIGHRLAMKLTRGRHAFLICTHVDKAHCHNHIIFNSTQLDCAKKFRNFWGSSFAIRKISDMLCLENGLSVVENPKPSRGSYGTWLGDEKPLTARDKLRALIDNSVSVGIFFDEFISRMKVVGVEVKTGKHLAFKAPGQERFIRCKSLGEDYTEDAIYERISGKRVVTPKKKIAPPVQAPAKPNLLIDIQAKIQQGYGAGFERYAKIFNLKEASKTLIFLQERGLTDYNLLSEKADTATKHFNHIGSRTKEIETRLSEITDLQKHIGAYSKTLDVYRQYRDGGWNKKFYAQHEDSIILHKAAKKAFDSLGLKKLPTIKTLQTEYATLAAEKKKLYQGYHPAKDEMIALCMAKQNVDRLMGNVQPQRKSQEQSL